MPRTLRHVAISLSVAALCAPVLLVAAGLTVFTNGAVADAEAINANFAGLDGRLGTLETPVPGTVANIAMVQTRAQGEYAAVVSGNGTEITPLRLTLTPKKAGNRVMLEWVVNGETHWNTVFVVTRNGVPLADTTNGANNRWAGVAATPYDDNQDSTTDQIVVKMFDLDSLATATTYELRIRSSGGTARGLRLNRAWASAGGDDYEATLSVGTATEIWW